MYTIYHPLVVDVSFVLFWDYACWLGPKQNTQNIYHKRMKDGVAKVHSLAPLTKEIVRSLALPSLAWVVMSRQNFTVTVRNKGPCDMVGLSFMVYRDGWMLHCKESCVFNFGERDVSRGLMWSLLTSMIKGSHVWSDKGWKSGRMSRFLKRRFSFEFYPSRQI